MLQSRIANGVRGRILKDATRDTGCGLKVFRRAVYLRLPYFDALHRFMPALVVREGFAVVHRDVVDRPRLTGVSNYGLFDRLWVGLLDLAGVWWLIRRKRADPRPAEIAIPSRCAGRPGRRMLIQLARDLPDYFYDVFVTRLDFWLVFGIVAQLVFGSRFILQWIASERAGRSVMPLSFWFLSILGGLMTLVYGFVRREPVIIIGQGLSTGIYLRNLALIFRERRRDVGATGMSRAPAAGLLRRPRRELSPSCGGCWRGRRARPERIPPAGPGDARRGRRPRLRTVVLRAADAAAGILRFHCDRRSDKAAEILAHPACALAAYDAAAKVQIRVEGRADLHTDDAVAEAAWAGSRAMSRVCYGSAPAPGTALAAGGAYALPDATVAGTPGRPHFAVVVVRGGAPRLPVSRPPGPPAGGLAPERGGLAGQLARPLRAQHRVSRVSHSHHGRGEAARRCTHRTLRRGSPPPAQDEAPVPPSHSRFGASHFLAPASTPLSYAG